MHRCGSLAIILASSFVGAGGEADLAAKIANARKELEPRTLTLSPGQYTPADFLTAVAKETGNQVLDRRATKSSAPLALDFNKAPFWPALDKFCTLAGCGYSAYGGDGVALVDAPKRSAHVSYHGITRTAIKRISVASDLESGGGTCVIHLDVAWEPRFAPFYLGLGPVTGEYVPRGVAKELKVKAPGRGQLSVAGRSACEVEIALPPPPRQSPALQSLEGSFKFLGPCKMLSFRFKEIKSGGALEQEEVSVRLLKAKEGPDRWLIELQIDNPEGTPVFESYQTWLDNNRITLTNAKGTLLPEPNETVLLETNRQAVIQYAFAAPRNGKLADWMLVCRTPGRMVELTVPYSFKNVPLP
jgi:hypothetical protein